MGQDLAKKSAPTFKKAWDRERRKLKEGDLLTLFPDAPRFVVQAEVADGVQVDEGDLAHLRSQDGILRVDRMMLPIGVVLDPPPALMRRIAAGELMFAGTVHAVHRDAGLIEIVIA
jgi:hypothetical protein